MATQSDISQLVIQAAPQVINNINDFSAGVLVTRGGRMGSGMGALLEGLWGYFTNKTIWENYTEDVEIAWLSDHEYNDFACVYSEQDWDPATRTGELFRIEAKSMNLDVDEAKGHFDEIQTKLSNNELLVVLLWRWDASEKGQRVYPAITDSFVNFAQPVAALRDDLHLLRGGWFNSLANCSEKPECGCTQFCRYEGEPINVKGVKERRLDLHQHVLLRSSMLRILVVLFGC